MSDDFDLVAWVLIIVLGVSAVSLRHAGARLLEDWFRRGVLVRNATIAGIVAILLVIAILSLTSPFVITGCGTNNEGVPSTPLVPPPHNSNLEGCVANYLTLIGLAALFAANAAFAFWAARRPTEVLRLVARRAPRDDGAGATAMTLVSRSAPYRWLLSGNDWFGFVQLAPVEPHRFPRLVTAIRSLGLVTLLLNLSIVTLVVALIVAARL